MFDLKNFKKVSQDDSSVEMRHKDGHSITIALKKLPRIQQEQLKRLKLAAGGEVEKMADGGEASSDNQDSSPDQQPAPAAAPPVVVNVGAAPNPYANQPGMQSPAAAQPPNPAVSQVGTPIAQPNVAVPQAVSNLNPNGTMNSAAVAKNTQTAGELQQNIDTARAKQQADTESVYLNQTAKNQQIAQQNYNDVKKHTDDYAQYMANNPIDPKHYWENLDTAHKVTGAIGLFLGGFKSGFAGGSNPAMDYLNSQIDRDISAQKSRADQQRTVYGAYRDLYGDSVAANAATKASMIDIYNHQVQQQAAKLGTPIAAQRAMQFNAAAAIDKSKALQDAAVDLNSLPGTRSTGGGGGGAGASQQKPATADDAYRNAGIDPTAPDKDDQLRAQGRDPQQYVQNYIKFANQHGGQGQQQGPEAVNDENSLLVPHANEIMRDRISRTPILKSKQPAIQNEIDNAQRAERMMQQLDVVMPELRKNATYSESVASSINPHAVAAVGGGIGTALGGPGFGTMVGAGLGEGAGHLVQGAASVTGGQQQIRYNAQKGILKKNIANALKGTNISGGAIDDIVEKTAPSPRDDDETYAGKIKELKDFIINGTDRSLLEQAGLWKKRK